MSGGRRGSAAGRLVRSTSSVAQGDRPDARRREELRTGARARRHPRRARPRETLLRFRPELGEQDVAAVAEQLRGEVDGAGRHVTCGDPAIMVRRSRRAAPPNAPGFRGRPSKKRPAFAGRPVTTSNLF